MEREALLSSIVDSLPYELVFVDSDHIIRYLNRIARVKFGDIVGRSIFDCHLPASNEMLKADFDILVREGQEFLKKVNDNNLRVYMTPVHDVVNGHLLGFYERFEDNTVVTPGHPDKKSAT